MEEHADQIPMLLNSSDPRKVRDNLVKIEVYFESFDYEAIIEVASYKVIISRHSFPLVSSRAVS